MFAFLVYSHSPSELFVLPKRAEALTNYEDNYRALIVFNPPLFFVCKAVTKICFIFVSLK